MHKIGICRHCWTAQCRKIQRLNALVGEKLAIVTSKPQTTRTRITGILTRGMTQFVFLDTPGIHKPRTKLGQRMVKTVSESVGDGDLTLMVFEPYGELTEAEQELVEQIRTGHVRAVAAINKTDCLKQSPGPCCTAGAPAPARGL